MKPHKRKITIVAIVALLVAGWLAGQDLIQRQAAGPASRASREDTFSPAHTSMSQALSHFFGRQSEPQQPLAFVHKVHVETVELSCADCHITVARGPKASIPDVRTCWNCHSGMPLDHPEMRKIKDYFEKGQDIPWQRVWGWVEESHVRFNHAPHIRAEVSCTTCHGDVSQMGVATRTIEHTMEFCVTCHREKKASDDCVTCHY